MNENINLCEILRGYEGESLYYSLTGKYYTFKKIIGEFIIIERVIEKKSFEDSLLTKESLPVCSNGRICDEGECLLFPSKDQRDWNKWAEEHKPKVPKTWDELCLSAQVEQITISTDIYVGDNNKLIDNSHAVGENNKLAKSALALLKIYQLIEVGYGCNVTDDEWKKSSMEKYIIEFYPIFEKDKICITYTVDKFSPIAFHTEEQAREFVSYPENVQLLKDFAMI